MKPTSARLRRGRRQGDGLIRGLILVGLIAILGGVWVGWRRPLPKYPKVAPSPRGPR